ncbi:phosphotransferase enzyme family protein [Elusimicrobiota bacterium]
MNDLIAVAEVFKHEGNVTDVREFGNGNINGTFLATLDAGMSGPDTCSCFVLQRINTQVFQQPELVMKNMRAVTEHVRGRLERAPLDTGRRWDVPRVLLTQDGQDHWIDSDKAFWRAISFIDAAQSFDSMRDVRHAKEVGYALGMFHTLISDLPVDRLADTLAGFHVTPLYLRHYNEVAAKHSGGLSPEKNYCLQFVKDRSAWAHVLEDARARGRLGLRPIHGDPKINNIMIDNDTGHAVSIVDLDTVKPGLVHYDIGDCLRSGCNPLGEETDLWETVRFEPDFCRAILQGYLLMAREFLTGDDHEYLYDAIRLIAFELGLRFFTDHLEGNVYFKAKHSSHNLARALVQFKLAESIESQESAIRSIIRDTK